MTLLLHGPYEITFPAGQTTQVLNIPITNDELFEASIKDFYVSIVSITSNCSVVPHPQSDEIQVQILNDKSTLCVPVN